MSRDPLDKLQTAQSWVEFCELLKKAGEVILREDLQTSLLDRAEGHRYLARLLRAGLLSFVENPGPLHPVFCAMPHGVKMGLDNPDNYYLSAIVSPEYDYRIRGERGTIHYMSFAAQSQNFAARDKIAGGAGHLNDAELECQEDGRFEIIASRKEHPGNWLRMTDQTRQILLRQTFLNRAQEVPVSVDIECLQAVGPPPSIEPERIEGMLKAGALYAIGAAQWFADWVLDFLNHAPMNDFHLPDVEKHRLMGGDPNIRMWLGMWKLEPDQALVIEATPPKCHYWNFQLGNIWAESLDARNRCVHVNSGGAVYRRDGSFRLVVCNRNPGIDNWIDTADHHHGTMALRWVRSDAHPRPRVRVVKIDEVQAGLD